MAAAMRVSGKLSSFICLLVVTLSFASFICFVLIHEAFWVRNDTAVRGHLNDLLQRQGLSHVAFHTQSMKNRLASLMYQTGNIAIVGVEWGADALALAHRGYRVYCFEPHTEYYKRLTSFADNPNLILHNIAAGPTEGLLNMSYQGYTNLVRMAPLRKFITSELDVLSVDIQGGEYGVLLGAQGIPVRSMWIEITSCNPRVRKLFHLLDEEYVIFDFVPWGRRKFDAIRTQSLAEMEFDGWRSRPSEFNAYLEYFCNMRQKFKWVQSDVLAVRRDVLTEKVMNGLATISNDMFIQSRKSKENAKS